MAPDVILILIKERRVAVIWGGSGGVKKEGEGVVIENIVKYN